MKISGLPIQHAEFTPDGRYCVITGRRKFYYLYDLEAGDIKQVSGVRHQKDQKYSIDKFAISPSGDIVAFVSKSGVIDLVSTRTWRWIGELLTGAGTIDMKWRTDGYLEVLNSYSEILCWDLRSIGTHQCVSKWADYGGFSPSTFDISSDGNMRAIGSQSGIVNVYDSSCLESANPKPVKSLGNLATTICSIKFHPSNQLLVTASATKVNQIRMVNNNNFNCYVDTHSKS